MKKFLSIFLLFILLMPTCLTFASSEQQPSSNEPQTYETNTSDIEALLIRENNEISLIRINPSTNRARYLEPNSKKKRSDDDSNFGIMLDENGNYLGTIFIPSPITMSGDEKESKISSE